MSIRSRIQRNQETQTENPAPATEEKPKVEETKAAPESPAPPPPEEPKAEAKAEPKAGPKEGDAQPPSHPAPPAAGAAPADKAEPKVETKAEPAGKAEPPPAANNLALRKQAGALATANDNVALVKYEGSIDPTDFGYGDIPRVMANNNMIFGPDKMRLGGYIDVQLLSYNQRWMVSPGSDDEEAKQWVRASYDGETISHTGEENGRSVKEYLEELKEAFPKAAIKEYVDVFCLMINAEEQNSGLLLQQDGILNISLSPMSKGKFLAYVKQIKLTVMRGLIAPEKSSIIRFKTQVKTGDRDYTILVATCPPREISDAAMVIEL